MLESDRHRRDGRGAEAGQSTLEYVGLLLLLSAFGTALLALAGAALPGGGLARAIAAKLICAVDGEDCSASAPVLSPIERAYGSEIAAMLSERAPEVSFEDGDFVSLPVDFRDCRLRACADNIRHGALGATQTGLPPVAFTRVIDCRPAAPSIDPPPDCSSERAGNVYLQYWLYYPESATRPFGRAGFHIDDWESFQVRVDPDGEALARASSHHGYNGDSGDPINDSGKFGGKPGWTPWTGRLHVAAGSHAGIAATVASDTRRIRSRDLALVPLEPMIEVGPLPEFAVAPPWEKGVWSDPEATGT